MSFNFSDCPPPQNNYYPEHYYYGNEFENYYPEEGIMHPNYVFPMNGYDRNVYQQPDSCFLPPLASFFNPPPTELNDEYRQEYFDPSPELQVNSMQVGLYDCDADLKNFSPEDAWRFHPYGFVGKKVVGTNDTYTRMISINGSERTEISSLIHKKPRTIQCQGDKEPIASISPVDTFDELIRRKLRSIKSTGYDQSGSTEDSDVIPSITSASKSNGCHMIDQWNREREILIKIFNNESSKRVSSTSNREMSSRHIDDSEYVRTKRRRPNHDQ